MTSALADLAALDALVTLAEHDAGVTAPGAVRPLHPWERDTTDWKAITTALTVCYTACEQLLGQYRKVLAESLTEAVRDLSRPEDVAAAIIAWQQTAPATVQAATTDVIRGLLAALTVLYSKGADIARRDARRQKAPVSDEVAPVDHGRLLPWAAAAALWTLARARQVAASDMAAGRPVDAVRGMSLAGGVDLGRQAAHQAHGAGRLAGVESVSAPVTAYASELLDGRSCSRCKSVDGKRFSTLAEALTDYPGMGGYKNCDGGPRCRGTLVMVYDIEAPPTTKAPYR